MLDVPRSAYHSMDSILFLSIIYGAHYISSILSCNYYRKDNAIIFNNIMKLVFSLTSLHFFEKKEKNSVFQLCDNTFQIVIFGASYYLIKML